MTLEATLDDIHLLSHHLFSMWAITSWMSTDQHVWNRLKVTWPLKRNLYKRKKLANYCYCECSVWYLHCNLVMRVNRMIFASCSLIVLVRRQCQNTCKNVIKKNSVPCLCIHQKSKLIWRKAQKKMFASW